MNSINSTLKQGKYRECSMELGLKLAFGMLKGAEGDWKWSGERPATGNSPVS